MDIERYNYMDVVLRKLKLGILMKEMKESEHGMGNEANANNKEDEDPDDDDDETKKVEGIMAIEIGPDGVPLKRNSSDVMNNFFVLDVVNSFTDIEEVLARINQADLRRKRRMDEEIEKRKTIWE